MSTTNDLCHAFAALVARARYEDLPPGAVDAAKKSILDTLGVILAGSGLEPRVRAIVDFARDAGGRGESSIFGYGDRVPATAAALANGAMAHCLDFDDRTPWGAHADSSAVPAALALAERIGGVSGRRLITAIALAQDLFTRVRCHVGWRQDWNLSPVVGAFSATAAASHVLGLDAERAAHALGIVSAQAAGTMETIFAVGGDLRGMYAGFTAQSAVTAALLAERGMTGIRTLFEGKAGIFNVYFGGQYDRTNMLDQLGLDFRGATTLYKPWPVVGIAHTYIHATIELMKAHRLQPADIGEIRVWIGEFQKQMCSPLEERRAPVKAVDAKFSLPFCVALAAVHGSVKLSHFVEGALSDPVVLRMAGKVVPVEDERYDWTSKSPEGRVAFVLTDGRVVERMGSEVPGSPEAPLAWDGIIAKFSDCASVANTRIAPATIRRAVACIRDLETLDDACDLVRLLI